MMTYRLPGSTARLVQRHVERCRNLGLVLDKFVPEEAIGKSEEKSKWLKGLAPSPPNDRLEMQVDLQLWEARYQRWLALTKAAGAVTFQAKLAWRMVVGLGGQSVLETDLTLEHLSGLPTIPGSALKGLTRTYAALEKSSPPSQRIETDGPDLVRVFGTQDHAGTVTFFDAMPMPPNHAPGRMRFAVDIMNPHYPDYYRENGKHAPSNDQSPVPVTFLTVEGATFAFAIAPRSSTDQADAHMTLEWLQEAVQKYGVGGKTSAGYGAFKVEGAAVSTGPASGMTEDEVWNWLGRKRAVTGTVEAQSQVGAILKLDDPAAQPGQKIPRGLLAGQSRPIDGRPLTCRVLGVQQEQGEWFVKVSA
jgi:CRISPR type III-B/RAMP module RAMP protein Cmr6